MPWRLEDRVAWMFDKLFLPLDSMDHISLYRVTASAVCLLDGRDDRATMCSSGVLMTIDCVYVMVVSSMKDG